MLKGIHIHSTAPSRAQKPDYRPSCLEVSSMVLSALLWRKNCGTIKLYTDSVFYAYLVSNGLTELWDGGIDTETIDTIPSSVNQTVFWAAAKLFALQHATAPVAMVDCDLFFWRDISKFINSECVTVLHREELVECYVSPEELDIPTGYQFDTKWSWKEKPCNTAFAFFPNDEFMSRFADLFLKARIVYSHRTAVSYSLRGRTDEFDRFFVSLGVAAGDMLAFEAEAFIELVCDGEVVNLERATIMEQHAGAQNETCDLSL